MIKKKPAGMVGLEVGGPVWSGTIKNGFFQVKTAYAETRDNKPRVHRAKGRDSTKVLRQEESQELTL